MAGSPQNLERGAQGGTVALDILFYQYEGGPLVDDDGYASLGTLPGVTIYDPDGNIVETSSTPERISTGSYQFTRSIALDDTISTLWKIRWSITINGVPLTFEEYFTVVASGDAVFDSNDSSETRIGYAFQNPDLTSSVHAPGWGLLVSPDELRYMVLFGTKLTSPDANQTYDDKMLQYFIDQAIALVERDLDISLLPRKVWYHSTPGDDSTGSLASDGNGGYTREDNVAGVTPESIEDDFNVVESGYPYRPNPARNYLFIKLRRRPLRSVTKIYMADPVNHQAIDLLDWMRPQTGFAAQLQFFPPHASFLSTPLASVKSLNIRYPFHNFPDAIMCDYEIGYTAASRVPREFRDVIRWIAGIQLMEDFGDGKAPGIASASANLNSISESYATTQSATNALYGARISYYKEHLKQWYTRNVHKYRRNFIGVL